MRHFQIYQFPIVVERPRAVNHQIRSPLLHGKRRRVPSPFVISVRQSPINQKSADSFHIGSVTVIRRRNRNHRLRRCERRKDLHRSSVPRHEIKPKGSPLGSRSRQTGRSLAQINLNGTPAVNQDPERREPLARHRLNFKMNHVHKSRSRSSQSQESAEKGSMKMVVALCPSDSCRLSPEVAPYRSISPSTISRVPMMATTSATR